MSEYTGVSNLEIMEEAVRYNRFLEATIVCHLSGGRVIDFGAGHGEFARRIRQRGWDLTAVELDPILQARLVLLGVKVLGDVRDVGTPADGAYSLNVLEHIEDDVQAATHLRAALRPGAPALIYVPAFPALFGAMDRKVGHVRRYTKASLQRCLESAGFEIEEIRYADSLGFIASLVLKWVGSSDGGVSTSMVRFYDRWLFPVSRMLDRLVDRWFGKNLIAVIRAPGAAR